MATDAHKSGRCTALFILGLFGLMPCARTEVPEVKSTEWDRTVSWYVAIVIGVQNYKEKFGEHPTPVKTGVLVKLDAQDFDVSGALALYQAITGDGDDKMRTALPAPKPSDGIVSEAEQENAILFGLPKWMIQKTIAGYILVDGYGHPIQYTVGGAGSINPTFDLWSFGKSRPPFRTDKASKQDAKITAGWLKNW